MHAPLGPPILMPMNRGNAFVGYVINEAFESCKFLIPMQSVSAACYSLCFSSMMAEVNIQCVCVRVP